MKSLIRLVHDTMHLISCVRTATQKYHSDVINDVQAHLSRTMYQLEPHWQLVCSDEGIPVRINMSKTKNFNEELLFLNRSTKIKDSFI